jgi:ferric-dicitrate binding protein FerR (iron transport regulator)
MSGSERLIALLELRRDGRAQPADLSEIDELLAQSNEVAAWAVESNELHRLLEQALRSPRRRDDAVEAAMRAVRALPRRSAASRVMGTVRGLDRRRARRARRGRRRVIRLFAGWTAAVAVIGIACGIWAVSQSGRGDPATFASGDGARIVRAGAESSLVAGAILATGDRIACGPGTATLTYADGTSLELLAGTRIEVQAGPGKRLSLPAGRMTAAVAPQRVPFAIATPHSVATIVGTRFVLDADVDRTRLSVNEGIVRIERPAGPGLDAAVIDVGTGHVAEARAGQALAAHAVEPLLSFDFEDGALPAHFAAGIPAAPPVAGGGRWCLAGTPEPQWAPDIDVVCIRRNGYVAFQDGLRCSLDFLVSEPVTTVGVMIYDANQGQNYGTEVAAPEPGRWHHLEFEFARLAPYLRSGERMAAGDLLDSLYIVPHGAVKLRLYVDDLVIWREVP